MKKNPALLIVLIASFSFVLGVSGTITNLANAQVTDTTPPTTTYVQTPSSPDGNNGWFVSTVQFDLTATDLESGVKEINYRLDSGTWQKATFNGTQNGVTNPSFETLGATSTTVEGWEATVVNPEVTFAQDTLNYAPGYASASLEMTTTGGSWHGFNNKANYVPATAFDNMSASVYLDIVDVPGNSNFVVYAIKSDSSEVQIAESDKLTGTTGSFVNLSVSFTTPVDTVGVYMDIGHTGPGTLRADAATINTSVVNPSTTIIVGSDSADHRLEFYAVDNNDNAESYSCTAPVSNCIDFKIDQTPPGNWHDSGAFRGSGGAEHELFVFTNVDDATSGLSTNSDSYQYKVDAEPDFGVYSDLLGCNSTWQPGAWDALNVSPTTDGNNTEYLETQKTDFCNSNWKVCKTVRFYAEDMAGNNTEKDFCLNGPWLSFVGEGTVRSDANIDMISEPPDDNTDGLIEAGGTTVNFFTSSVGRQVVGNSSIPSTTYDQIWNLVTATKTEITGGDLVSSTGVYYINGDYIAENATIPNNYDSETFDQIVFVNGNLTIEDNIEVDTTSTALFVVNGNVNVAKSVDYVRVAIVADGIFYNAYDINPDEASKTLYLNGFYSADSFVLQRTLQGTQNNSIPSDLFTYEPKYLIQLKQFFGGTGTLWRYDQ